MSDVATSRWERGVPHRPESLVFVRSVNELDTDGRLDLKLGGDGDLGENLAYYLDELLDRGTIAFSAPPAAPEREPLPVTDRVDWDAPPRTTPVFDERGKLIGRELDQPPILTMGHPASPAAGGVCPSCKKGNLEVLRRIDPPGAVALVCSHCGTSWGYETSPCPAEERPAEREPLKGEPDYDALRAAARVLQDTLSALPGPVTRGGVYTAITNAVPAAIKAYLAAERGLVAQPPEDGKNDC